MVMRLADTRVLAILLIESMEGDHLPRVDYHHLSAG